MVRAVEVVRRFRRLRALVIGDAMLDSYLEGTAARLCTEGPVPVVRKTAEERVPGGAANTAANLRALGAEVVFLGLVGEDVPGDLLRAALAARGVDDRWLVADPAVSTLHKLRILADGQYVVRFDEGDSRAASPAAHARLLEHLEHAVPTCDVVVVSDYAYGAVADDLIAQLRTLRAARHCPLVVDSKALHRFHAAGATVVTPNYLEARLAVAPGAEEPGPLDLAEVKRIGRGLLEQVDAAYAAITLGADGVFLLGRDGAGRHLPVHPPAQASDIGAGDTFAAALGLALAAGADVVEASRIGIDAAGIAVACQRTAAVPYQDLLRRVSLCDLDGRPASMAAARRDVVARLDVARLAGRTIVFTNGVFDILHAGHVEFLRRARALGDLLIVGVNSDRSARRLKGAGRPINSERDRLALVAALDAVDEALLFDEATPAELIRALRPHIHAKGGDYSDVRLPEAEAVRAVGGRVVILPLVSRLSTSGVIDRIVALAGTADSAGIGTNGAEP
ncbi:PfkB family carbohydrate kinase [Sphaerobacter thermophilus]|uniref:Bifunctional protein HldE n=1 Tax=Sphaerobacter thermophilus (strain ATCC 49802 / DSM 20745 / KCCM 41009 / NCIMB 13125 / S 6022) TaxID=479434 RepID=D1C5G5_SPHTD|nr:PfkB family carbohydrate kinase [Sphaerobacter thermophilus]ACZ37481.1 cytidyltransferase-related domain protein [Sphaerobacter thermophilus DSM 20745]